MLSSSSSSSSFTDAWLPGPYGTNFYTRTFHAANPCAVLVFVHGAAEHCGRYHALHTQLAAEHDIAVFAFDLRGFGQTALHPTQRSATSAYGKTDWDKQLDDVEWALRRTEDEFPGLSVFLMGASMGGGIVLGLLCDVERAKTPVVSSLAGVIASAPCITPTTPPPRPVYWLGRIASYALAPARVKPQELSRNTETNSAYVADPFVIAPGSWRCRLDMLSAGKRILEEGYAHWPEDTPVLFLHGDADPVNSVEGTNTLYGKITAQDKKLITYSGAYHELHNEPDGVKEKYLLDVVDFVHAHLQCV
ncbi:Alpha/Beta hydrolase protein [Mycena albidolilacea]|uniref:Alpha/Beta hydrolase protein n=1 Tax=Mycena albidolilacea TaxID=1033008 RepID=A0AAD7EVB1_9AGAR|nr:Alpha/Beta hydrolase protein [Mycena albidolilacea]